MSINETGRGIIGKITVSEKYVVWQFLSSSQSQLKNTKIFKFYGRKLKWIRKLYNTYLFLKQLRFSINM